MYKYISNDLLLNPTQTLILIDWDDTLFPSSWIVYNKINLHSESDKIKYLSYFQLLDLQIYKTLKKISDYGTIIIITNALLSWIFQCLELLPKTKVLLEKIKVVSAREKYQDTSTVIYWKINTFIDEIKNYPKANNIISFGDADYEYKALINLFNDKFIPHKYLKSVKFIKSNNFNLTLEQLINIRKFIKDIYKRQRHIDMVFEKL